MSPRLRAALLLAFLGPAAAAAPLHAPLAIKYFIISPANPDFPEPCCNFYNGLALPNLGPHFLPRYNPNFPGALYAGLKTSPINLAPTGELTLWSPALNPTISPAPIPSGTASLPFSANTGATNVYTSAVYSGTFTLPKPATLALTLQTSGEALLYIDNTQAAALIGVHPPAQTGALATNITLPAGPHTLTVFYDSRTPTENHLAFSLDTTPLTPPPPVKHGLGGLPGPIHTGPQGCGPLFSTTPCPP